MMFKCEKCNAVFDTIVPCDCADCTITCCEQPVNKLEPKKEEEGFEKHLPVVEKTETGIKVKVGSVPHPMEETHHIAMIEVIAGDMVYRKFLKPGDEPVAEFPIDDHDLVVREYCTVHGLWET